VIEVTLSLIAVAGTLLGATLAYVFQSRLIASQRKESRRDRRREEYIDAAADLAAAVATLIPAEFARAKLRFAGVQDERREKARQKVYDERSSARSAGFRLQLVGNPALDETLVIATEELINLCRSISAGSTTPADAEKRMRSANAALDSLIRGAHQRANEM
jgi:hypothetical protein